MTDLKTSVTYMYNQGKEDGRNAERKRIIKLIDDKIQEYQERIDHTSIEYDLYLFRELKTEQNILRKLKKELEK